MNFAVFSVVTVMVSLSVWPSEKMSSEIGSAKSTIESRVHSGYEALLVFEFGDLKIKVRKEYGITAWSACVQLYCKANQSDCRNLRPDATPSPIMLGALGVDKDPHEKFGSFYNKVVPYSIGGGDSKALSALEGEDQV
jgi:hypothetical protein